MAQIFKHTFYEDKIAVKDGELVLLDPEEYTMNFSLKMKGTDLFEQEYGKPLFPTITKILAKTEVKNPEDLKEDDFVALLENSDALLESRWLKALATACYIKIDGAQVYNNEQTAMEFKESPVYSLVASDFEFIGKLLSMTIECLMDDKAPQKKGKQLKQNKNAKSKN